MLIGPITASADLYGNEPSETTGPVGPYGTAEHRGIPESHEPPPVAPDIPVRGIYGSDFLDEMLTLMIAHAQMPAVLRALHAGQSLVDVRA